MLIRSALVRLADQLKLRLPGREREECKLISRGFSNWFLVDVGDKKNVSTILDSVAATPFTYVGEDGGSTTLRVRRNRGPAQRRVAKALGTIWPLLMQHLADKALFNAQRNKLGVDSRRDALFLSTGEKVETIFECKVEEDSDEIKIDAMGATASKYDIPSEVSAIWIAAALAAVAPRG